MASDQRPRGLAPWEDRASPLGGQECFLVGRTKVLTLCPPLPLRVFLEISVPPAPLEQE